MPAPNGKKIYIHLCLRSRQFEFHWAKRIASDHTSPARVAVFFKAIQGRKMSTSLTFAEENLSKKASNERYIDT